MSDDEKRATLEAAMNETGVKRADIWYPRSCDDARVIEIGLVDVRAADSIRVHYDFERDGYVISQPKDIAVPWPDGHVEHYDEWHEVHFAKAWNLQEGDE